MYLVCAGAIAINCAHNVVVFAVAAEVLSPLFSLLFALASLFKKAVDFSCTAEISVLLGVILTSVLEEALRNRQILPPSCPPSAPCPALLNTDTSKNRILVSQSIVDRAENIIVGNSIEKSTEEKSTSEIGDLETATTSLDISSSRRLEDISCFEALPSPMSSRKEVVIMNSESKRSDQDHTRKYSPSVTTRTIAGTSNDGIKLRSLTKTPNVPGQVNQSPLEPTSLLRVPNSPTMIDFLQFSDSESVFSTPQHNIIGLPRKPSQAPFARESKVIQKPAYSNNAFSFGFDLHQQISQIIRPVVANQELISNEGVAIQFPPIAEIPEDDAPDQIVPAEISESHEEPTRQIHTESKPRKDVFVRGLPPFQKDWKSAMQQIFGGFGGIKSIASKSSGSYIIYFKSHEAALAVMEAARTKKLEWNGKKLRQVTVHWNTPTRSTTHT